ncbi:MAG: RnfABCDGE type electron transport complex subunit D [Woeseiaceae bacterium]|nr:RnfABCDGE type electron transport complex subunit D [Woeseiaceae bacterium]
MQFERLNAPHIRSTSSVPRIMLQVLLALVPAAIAHVWFFGPGFLFNLIIATGFCVASEAAMMVARGRPPEDALSDYSAVVTAALIAFALPSLTPWWVTAIASTFGIVVAKHLYGGIGFNVFNPAMAGYVVVLVAFPADMNLWVAPRMGDTDYTMLSLVETLTFTLTGWLPEALTYDAVSRATPLDLMKSGLNQMQTVEEIRALPVMGDFGGRGWEWIGNFLALGGIWLMIKRVIRWQIPLGVLAGVLTPATIAFLIEPGSNPGPGYHLFSGATILCAFFVATDPVSAATSTRGRIVYGVGIGFLIYAIRKWGAYADGAAFGVLLMNMAVPAIDAITRPRIVGHGGISRE